MNTGDNVTRTSVSFGQTSSTWNNGDRIGLYSLNNKTVKPFNITTSGYAIATNDETNSPTTTVKSSQLGSVVSQSENLVAFYPYTSKITDGKIYLSFGTVYASSTGGINNASWDYMYSKTLYNYYGDRTYRFKRVYGIIGITLYNMPAGEWNRMSITSSDNDFCKTGTLDLATGNTTIVKTTNTLTHDYYRQSTTDGGSLLAYFPTLPCTAKKLTVSLVSCDGKEYKTTIDRPVTVTKGGFNLISINTRPSGSDIIDIGMDVVWAKRNIGASKPSQPGTAMTWEQAREKTSGNWRLPTKEELTELACKNYQIENIDNTPCYVYNGTKGNNLILPSAGINSDGKPYLQLWSCSTPYYSYRAYAGNWGIDGNLPLYYPTNNEFYARLVCDKMFK